MEEKHRLYLNQLRRDGTTNMFGAGAYLQTEFYISSNEAKVILGEWMEQFTQENGDD